MLCSQFFFFLPIAGHTARHNGISLSMAEEEGEDEDDWPWDDHDDDGSL